jgi:hypothetical protein
VVRYLIVGLALLAWGGPLSAAQTVPLVRNGVFDVNASRHYSGIGVARIYSRATDANRYEPGLEFRFADALVWTPPMTQLEGSFGASLRVLSQGYALSLAQSGGLAGLRFGPVQLKAGVSLSLLNLDVVQERWGFGMFWPRSMAGVGLALGPVRVDALAHVEYLWRWSGADQYVRGVGLLISLERRPIGPNFR